MSASEYQIPEEYRRELRYVEPADTHSDVELLAALEKHVPVSSEKNVWAFWDSGISTIPAWCQRNITSWIRLNSPGGWTVRLVDSIEGSPNHWSKFVPANMVPPAFAQGTMDGPYVGQHSADALRGALLYLFGGVFLDVSCILLRTFDRICWNQLEDPASPFQVAVCSIQEEVIQNAFFAARKGDPFIRSWHDLFVQLWSTPATRTNYVGLRDSPLLQCLNDIPFPVPPIGLKVTPRAFEEYVAQIFCWMRMCRLSAPDKEEDQLDYNKYWRENVLAISMIPEGWGAEEVAGFDGKSIFSLLTLKVEPPRPEDADYRQATKLVWRILTNSSLQKVYNGKELLLKPALGAFLSKPENLGKDSLPGTFAGLLRYGAEHFEQTRPVVNTVTPAEIKDTIYKGYLEL
jgi:hypothetical protein